MWLCTSGQGYFLKTASPLHCLFRNQPSQRWLFAGFVYFTAFAFFLGAFPLTGILFLESQYRGKNNPVTKRLVWPIQDCFLFYCLFLTGSRHLGLSNFCAKSMIRMLVFSAFSQLSYWCRRHSRQLNLMQHTRVR